MPAGIVFLVLATIAAVHALVFRAYINKYKETYSIIETVGGFNQPVTAKHRV